MPDFQTQECEGFFEHWQSLPKDGLAPTSETFLDQAHPAYAPMICVLEHADTDLIVRLMGTGLVERWGMDRTGKKAIEHEDPKVRDAFSGTAFTSFVCPVECTSLTASPLAPDVRPMSKPYCCP